MTDDAYSKCGQTNYLNTFIKMSLSRQVNVLRVKPKFLLAILIFELDAPRWPNMSVMLLVL